MSLAILFHFLCAQHVSILIYPSSGACDYSVELPHWSYYSWFDVFWNFGVVGLEWYPCCRLKHNCNTDTTPTQPYRISNTHRTKNNTTNVVIQQNSRKLLMMDILMSETCWAHKKWNKIATDIKLVFYSSTITMIHGPINIRFNYTPLTVHPVVFWQHRYAANGTEIQRNIKQTNSYWKLGVHLFWTSLSCLGEGGDICHRISKTGSQKNGNEPSWNSKFLSSDMRPVKLGFLSPVCTSSESRPSFVIKNLQEEGQCPKY